MIIDKKDKIYIQKLISHIVNLMCIHTPWHPNLPLWEPNSPSLGPRKDHISASDICDMGCNQHMAIVTCWYLTTIKWINWSWFLTLDVWLMTVATLKVQLYSLRGDGPFNAKYEGQFVYNSCLWHFHQNMWFVLVVHKGPTACIVKDNCTFVHVVKTFLN